MQGLNYKLLIHHCLRYCNLAKKDIITKS